MASGVTLLSPRIAVFNGERYWWQSSRRVFVRALLGRRAKLLHREVYSDTYGNIPHGWEVHHRDRDRKNNEIDNLRALAPLDHRREHREERIQRAADSREILLDNLSRGRTKPRPTATFICAVCGKEYQARPSHGRRANTCCSGACHSVAYRRRLKERVIHG